MTVEERLEKIEALLVTLVERQTVRDWYTTEQAAQMLGKAEFTVRSWCRLGRIRARKKDSGRGAHNAYAISHEELQRVQGDGLLPIS
jgi:transposase